MKKKEGHLDTVASNIRVVREYRSASRINMRDKMAVQQQELVTIEV